MIPVPLPPHSIYTSYYCEENIYCLCQAFWHNDFLKGLWEIFVVFISNPNKTVALWCQQAARFEGCPVVWDYHVILVLRPQRQLKGIQDCTSWVYDFDTQLPIPCKWKEYLDTTFKLGTLSDYASQFRVLPGDLFLEHFASDRTHMLVKTMDSDKRLEEKYSYPPPTYLPICGPSALREGTTNNLMSHYVSMVVNEGSFDGHKTNYGVVLDRAGVDKFFTV